MQVINKFYIEQCNDCVIVLKGYCKEVKLNKCSQTKIKIDGILGKLKIMNCKMMKIEVYDFVQAIKIDKCDDVELNLTNKTKFTNVTTEASKGVLMKYPKVGNDT